MGVLNVRFNKRSKLTAPQADSEKKMGNVQERERSGLGHTARRHQCTVGAEIMSRDEILQKEAVECEERGLEIELLER